MKDAKDKNVRIQVCTSKGNKQVAIKFKRNIKWTTK